MNSGIYIHIPYCLQQCPYCDFATVLHNHAIRPETYVEWIKQEIQNRAASIPFRKVQSIYFGGGTPSLLSNSHILAILKELENQGFEKTDTCEVTLEINPGTLSEEFLDELTAAGINRYSVGAQTFNPDHLNQLGRKHSAKETRETLSFLDMRGVNYTFDLLYAFPSQTLKNLEEDLQHLRHYKPKHVSAYCLTVPSGHPMSHNRPSDDVQADMFYLIDEFLNTSSWKRYEISNFSQPGFESRHNQLYWSDGEYWGLGMSAHSYLKTEGYGVRFWNAPQMTNYHTQLSGPHKQFPYEALPNSQVEHLGLHQALTDYCHTHLRTTKGLNLEELQKRYQLEDLSFLEKPLQRLQEKKLVEYKDGSWALSHQALVLSELVYRDMTFLKSELPRNLKI